MRLRKQSRKSLSTVCAIALCSVLLVTPSPTHAATGPWTTITQIYARTGSGKHFIYMASGGMPGCYNDRGAYLGNVDPENEKAAYSALLAALLGDREVQVFYTITGQTGWSMCTIDAVYIR